MWLVDRSFCVCCSSRFHLLHRDRPSINSTAFEINSHVWKLGIHASAFFCLPGRMMNNSNSIYYQGCTSCRCFFVLYFLKFSGFGILRNVTERLTAPSTASASAAGRPRSRAAARQASPGGPRWRPLQSRGTPPPEGPEPYGMRRLPLRVRRPFVLEQETI